MGVSISEYPRKGMKVGSVNMETCRLIVMDQE